MVARSAVLSVPLAVQRAEQPALWPVQKAALLLGLSLVQ